MARYISRYPNFTFEVFKPTYRILTGEMGPYRETDNPGYIAEFRRSGLTEREKEFAKERFKDWKGLYEGEDPFRRISLFDLGAASETLGWDEKVFQAALKRMDENEGDDFVKIPEYRVPKPWPSYDEMEPTKIAVTAHELGLDLALVAAYEQENLDREDVLDELTLPATA